LFRHQDGFEHRGTERPAGKRLSQSSRQRQAVAASKSDEDVECQVSCVIPVFSRSAARAPPARYPDSPVPAVSAERPNASLVAILLVPFWHPFVAWLIAVVGISALRAAFPPER